MKLKTVLACTDFSTLATDALRTAASLARASGARLVVVHVFDPPLIFEHDDGAVLDPRGTQTEYLAEDVSREKLADDAQLIGTDLEVSTRFATGRVVDRIEAVAEEENADVIVIGTHGRRGLARLVLGSVAVELLHVASIPVLAVHPEATSLDEAKRIVFPTDFSRASAHAVDYVATWAKHFGAKVTVFHVLDRPSSYVYDPLLREYRGLTEKERLRSKQGERLTEVEVMIRRHDVDVETELIQGSAAATIVKRAAELEADLIVVGARGHTPVGRLLLGSVADNVLRTAKCAVLVIPPED